MERSLKTFFPGLSVEKALGVGIAAIEEFLY
nr:MAG TPA: hypothetical protein [Caudoviricetes sp.]